MPANDTYSADQIVNKTLTARSQVDVFDRVPGNGGKKIAVVKSGYPVGVVYSWVQDTDKSLWWQFKSSDGSWYYVKHASGIFDVTSLKQQGALTTLEKIEQEQNADKPWYAVLGETAQKAITNGLLILAGVVVAKEFIKSNGSK
jgi:hypothetical protein